MEGARKQRDTLSGHHTETETCLSDSLRRLSPVTQTSWIAITGAPGSGKSTLIDALKAHGLTTVSEAARTYIQEQTQRGLSVADIRADGRQFLSAILDRSIAKAENTDPSKLIFFDRGIPDTIAYQRSQGFDDEAALRAASRFRYRAVFLLDPIDFNPDEIRTETPEEALKLHEAILTAYRQVGYEPISIPLLPPEERLALILKHISAADQLASEAARSLLRMREIQAEVHDVVRHLGGYWPPLAATARVLEELGELIDAVQQQDSSPEQLAGEVADLFVISTCIANQYLVRLRSPSVICGANEAINDEGSLAEIIRCCSKLARCINAYEGPKALKPGEEPQSLQRVIEALQVNLCTFAIKNAVDLSDAITTVLQRSRNRDVGRFPKLFDPSLAPCLDNFAPVVRETSCPFAHKAKIWGAPTWDETQSPSANIAYITDTLDRFVKVGQAVGLDALLVEMPGYFGKSSDSLASALHAFLTELSARDPDRSSRSSLLQMRTTGQVERKWDFTYRGEKFFLTTFAPCYNPGSGRSTCGVDKTFIMMQPHHSFDRALPRDLEKRKEVHKLIKEAFAQDGKEYQEEHGGQPLSNAAKYIKANANELILWWTVEPKWPTPRGPNE